jgi:hypothetical protein
MGPPKCQPKRHYAAHDCCVKRSCGWVQQNCMGLPAMSGGQTVNKPASGEPSLFWARGIWTYKMCVTVECELNRRSYPDTIQWELVDRLRWTLGLVLVSDWSVCYPQDSGFGGLVVSMLASGTQNCGFEPGLSRRIFWAKKFAACFPLEGK